MIDAETIYSLIYKRFKGRGYSVIRQVRSRPGSDKNIRTADALAISQSALRDTSFIGFEIKVSKADFMGELANPEKADAVAQYCNKWYVAAPKGLIAVSEMPEKWGLLEATKGRITLTKTASDLPCVQPTREFVAMIVRRVEGGEALKSEYWRGYRDGMKEEKNKKGETTQKDHEELEKLRKAVKTFEASSGIDFFYWDDERSRKIGTAVGLIKDGSVIYDVKRAKEIIEDLLRNVNVAIQELEANPLGIPKKEAP